MPSDLPPLPRSATAHSFATPINVGQSDNLQNSGPSSALRFARSMTQAHHEENRTTPLPIVLSKQHLLHRATHGPMRGNNPTSQQAITNYVNDLIRHSVEPITPDGLKKSLEFLDQFSGYKEKTQERAVKFSTNNFNFGLGPNGTGEILNRLINKPNMNAIHFGVCIKNAFNQSLFNLNTLDAIHSAVNKFILQGGRVSKENCEHPADFFPRLSPYLSPGQWHSLMIMLNKQRGYVEEPTPTGIRVWRDPQQDENGIQSQSQLHAIASSAQQQGIKRQRDDGEGDVPSNPRQRPKHSSTGAQDNTRQRYSSAMMGGDPFSIPPTFDASSSTGMAFLTQQDTHRRTDHSTPSRRRGPTWSSTADIPRDGGMSQRGHDVGPVHATGAPGFVSDQLPGGPPYGQSSQRWGNSSHDANPANPANAAYLDPSAGGSVSGYGGSFWPTAPVDVQDPMVLSSYGAGVGPGTVPTHAWPGVTSSSSSSTNDPSPWALSTDCGPESNLWKDLLDAEMPPEQDWPRLFNEAAHLLHPGPENGVFDPRAHPAGLHAGGGDLFGQGSASLLPDSNDSFAFPATAQGDTHR